MNRRSFISSIITACAAPLILPGAGRLWKPSYDLYTGVDLANDGDGTVFISLPTHLIRVEYKDFVVQHWDRVFNNKQFPSPMMENVSKQLT